MEKAEEFERVEVSVTNAKSGTLAVGGRPTRHVGCPDDPLAAGGESGSPFPDRIGYHKRYVTVVTERPASPSLLSLTPHPVNTPRALREPPSRLRSQCG